MPSTASLLCLLIDWWINWLSPCWEDLGGTCLHSWLYFFDWWRQWALLCLWTAVYRTISEKRLLTHWSLVLRAICWLRSVLNLLYLWTSVFSQVRFWRPLSPILCVSHSQHWLLTELCRSVLIHSHVSSSVCILSIRKFSPVPYYSEMLFHISCGSFNVLVLTWTWRSLIH